ncbi:response regulator [Pseudomonas sp. ANT_J12]|uniref:response regulator n=1 Tax=Pseudomonas sp. ANT_J12 TaxID=2597351 RepID=UPI0011F2E576|nr:response regulator [Pseudomonas sp. ANT_J12]KAA0995328.1 response regulator [Pseudomonas sp. ANT_J12]
MRVMILDDDPWISDLLKQLVLSIRPVAQIDCFIDVASALDAWQPNTYQLVMADWNLPDAPGVNLLQKIREKDQDTPLIMITGRADRDSVLAVKSLRISAFFTKPFQVSRVVQFLDALLPLDEPPQTVTLNTEDLISYLSGLSADELDLPLLASVKDKLQLGYGGASMDLREHANDWQHDPALCAHLIAAANGAAYLGLGQRCTNLNGALTRLGGLTSVNLAISQALRQTNTQLDGMLMTLVQAHLDDAEQLAEKVVLLAQQCGLDPAPLQCAALLHRMGELCVLYQTRKWENQGNSVDEETLSHAVRDFAAPFAVRLKARWGLPMVLRELIGAIYALPPMQVRREQVVMRLAAAMNNGESEADVERLQRLAGLA